MKPDKQQINELERRLAQSWRTVKNLKQNFDSMSEEEIKEELSDLQVDMVLEDGNLSDLQ